MILFVGYQAAGTLGRTLADGAERVKLFGEEIEVDAEIGLLAGTSGHADRDGLIDWLDSFAEKPKRVFVNHGDDISCTSFAKLVNERFGVTADAPYSGTTFDLLTGKYEHEAEGVPVTKKKKRAATVYNRLLASIERLSALARRCEGYPNKELARLADQIDMLCDKFEN